MGADEIAIGRMIVHKVDRRNQSAPQLADLESPIDNPELLDFLRSHVRANREHTHTRRARFREEIPAGAPNFAGLAEALLVEPGQFVPASRQIACHLFGCMDLRTSPGDLIVTTYTEGDPATPSLALLKMDPEDSFTGRRREVDGQVQFVLERVSDVLPTKALQKSAFVLHPSVRAARGYDLMVLDQQTARRGAVRMVSSFFSSNFLQCRMAYEPARLTDRFYFESFAWIDRQAQWAHQARELAKQRIQEALYLEKVDAEAIAQEITADAGEQEGYLGHLSSRELDLSFEPDETRRERLLRYAVYEGDNELTVRVLASAVGLEGTVQIGEPDPATGLRRVVIETRHWAERPR